MSMSDPIADMLTRIRNAQKARMRTVDIPASSLKTAIARILTEQRLVYKYQLLDDQKQGIIRVYLKYTLDEKPVIQGLRRVSTPGRRVYARSEALPRVRNGMGMALVSTNQGLLTDAEARQRNVGGEVLAYIW
jgi:small subunit ribosomal protein S8